MTRRQRRSILFAFSLLLAGILRSQTIPVGLPGMDDALRRLQLQEKISPEYSLSARPFFTRNELGLDSIRKLIDNTVPSTRKKGKGETFITLLPFQYLTKFSSDHPYGWNDAGFIQAKGIQQSFSAGIYAQALKGFISVQFAPEYVYAANSNFDTTAEYGASTTGAYSHVFPGQSSIRLNFRALSLGVSTENLWWGPGINNSLLMSNNAPGFPHLTFNTRYPLKTPVGSFEWQVIMGKMQEDRDLMLENKNLSTSYYNQYSYDGSSYSGEYDAKYNWRYLNGLTITYQPKWIPGLFIGINRVAYAYRNSIDSAGTEFDFIHKYFPTIFGAFRGNYAYGTATDNHAIGYKQIASLHVRMLFPKSHFEAYAEYGVHDNAFNARDLFIDPQHAAAYTVGFKKMKPLNYGKWLDISAEVTHMAQSTDYLTRPAGDWYMFRGGYTHQSQIMGAGIGPGNNLQSLSATYIDGFKKLGIMFQRLQHQPVLGSSALGLATFGLRDVQWNDVAIGVNGQYRYKKWMANADIQFISTNGYGWVRGSSMNLYGTIKLIYFW